jgi:hypothetical protein
MPAAPETKKRGRPPKAQVVESSPTSFDEQFDSVFSEPNE